MFVAFGRVPCTYDDQFLYIRQSEVNFIKARVKTIKKPFNVANFKIVIQNVY